MIRAGTDADVPAAAAMRQRAWPDSIITAEGMAHALAVPALAELVKLAAEEDGEIVGWVTAGRMWWASDADHGTLMVTVDPSAQGRGIGSALADRADRHLDELGIRTTRAGSLDTPAARALATGRGFSVIGSSTVSAVDPRTVEPLEVPADVTIVPFAGLDDPAPVYELDLEVSQDIPNEQYDAITPEEWVRDFWRVPVIDDDASLAAFVDGRLAAITMIRVDRPSGRAQNNLTGVLRPFRGRGLAALLKSHSLRRAAELGATIAITDNDATNAPMLAVNGRLGYRPFARRLEWERVTGLAG